MINKKDLCDIEVDGIDRRDHPDYCDAFISAAFLKSENRSLTSVELDELNEDGSFVREQVEKSLR